METIGWGGGENYHRGRQENRDGGRIGAGVLTGRRRLRLKDGRSLRLLTAMEVLEARREAEALVREDRERALCSNACLLAKALERRGRAVYPDGETVLRTLRVEEIGELARQWAAFNREENPSVLDGEGVVDALKKAWSTRPTSA